MGHSVPEQVTSGPAAQQRAGLQPARWRSPTRFAPDPRLRGNRLTVMTRPEREVYSHSHHSVVLGAHASRTAEEAAAFLLPHLEPGMEILDLGCGPGSITVGLARYVAPSRVIGVDRATAALDAARDHAAEAHLDNVGFTLANVYELPFDDESFDVVYAHQLMQHLADPVAALGEARRVLRPGGYIAVRDADYGTMTHHPQEPAIDRRFADYCETARANGGEPDAGRRLLGWVQAAGYEHLHATTSSWTFATDDERRWWAELWVGRAERGGTTHGDDLVTIAEGFRHWAAQANGWFAFIHGEVIGQKPPP